MIGTLLRCSALLSLALVAGCVCTTGSASSPPNRARPVSAPPPSTPPPVVHYKFLGPHPAPSGGWDETSGRHTHTYAPVPMSGFRRNGEWHEWIGGNANDRRGGDGNSANTSTNRTPSGSGDRDDRDEKDDDDDRRRKRDRDDD